MNELSKRRNVGNNTMQRLRDLIDAQRGGR